MSEAVASDAVFPFTQFEFGFLLGPSDGRYLRRAGEGGEADRVVVLQTLGAQRRVGRGRRPKRAEPTSPAPIPTARATLVGTEPFGSHTEAAAWLDGVRRDQGRVGEEVSAAARDLNLVLRAHRAAAADPYAREVTPEQALAVRLGYGRGDEVAEGRFAEAYELPAAAAPRRRRLERLDPQERLADILGGRDRLLVCEELVLRARADLDAGRPREAALQARIALEALLAELAPETPNDSLTELSADRDLVGAGANAALEADPSDELQRGVEQAVERMESAIRRHRLRRL